MSKKDTPSLSGISTPDPPGHDSYLRLSPDCLPCGFTVIDANGTIISANRRLHELLAIGSDTLTGTSLTDHIPSDTSRTELIKTIRNSRKRLSTASVWFGSLKKSNGETIDVRLDIVAGSVEGDQARTCCCTVTETGHSLPSPALRESEAKYRSLVENSFEGIGILRQGYFIFANRSLLDIFGYMDPGEFYRIPLVDHLLPAFRKAYLDHQKKKTTRSVTLRYQYRIKRRDGQIRVIDVAPSEITLNGETYRQNTFLDVTDQIEAMDSLKIFRHIVSSVPDRLTFIDRDSRFLAVNDAFLDLHNLYRQDVIGKTIKEVFHDSPFSRALGEYLAKAFRNEEVHSIIWFDREDEDPLLLDISLYPFCEEGIVSGVTISSRDVTQEIHLGMEVLTTGERERRQIGIELHDGLSHELLGHAIQARILGESLAEKKLDPEAAMAEKIEQGLNTAIGQIRTIAQGLFPPSMNNLEIRYQLEKLKTELMEAHGINCEIRFRGEVKIRDPKQAFHLSHILQEAVRNIVRHAEAKNVQISYVANANDITLTVRDDGKGVDTTRHSGDMGLGMNIMQYRAHMIGGSLDVRSLPAGGTELVCRIRQQLARMRLQKK